MVEDGFKGVFAEDEEVLCLGRAVVLASQAVGTHLELMGGLLTADVENLLLRHAEHGLEREGGLADARLTT